MENKQNYNKESEFIEISVSNDILFMCSDLYNFEQIKKQLTKIFIKIFKFNDFVTNEQFINKYFEHSLNMISENLNDNTIKSNKDLKYYIQNEIYLTISNNEFLFNKFFNNQYLNVQNFLFVNE